LILFGDFSLGWSALLVVMSSLLLLWIALRFFRKLAGHFEDFL